MDSASHAPSQIADAKVTFGADKSLNLKDFQGDRKAWHGFQGWQLAEPVASA